MLVQTLINLTPVLFLRHSDGHTHLVTSFQGLRTDLEGALEHGGEAFSELAPAHASSLTSYQPPPPFQFPKE